MSTKEEETAPVKQSIASKDARKSTPHEKFASSSPPKRTLADMPCLPSQNIGNAACANKTVSAFVKDTSPANDNDFTSADDSSIQQSISKFVKEKNLPSSLQHYLFPDIKQADEEDRPAILYLYKKILQVPKITEILLSNWHRWEMEEQFSLLMEGAISDLGKENVEKKESVIARIIRLGLLAEQDGDFIYVLKCCLDDNGKIKNREDIASLLGQCRDAWLLKANRNQLSEYSGQRLSASNDMYDRNSETAKSPNHLLEYEYTEIGTCSSQHGAFLGEQICTMWMLAIWDTLTVNRNCYWCINDKCKSTQHQFGVLRVSAREGIMNRQLGIFNDWSQGIVRSIQMEDHLFTLEERKSGESGNPDALFIKNLDLLKIYYQKHIVSKDDIWVVDPKKCNDYNNKNGSSNLYNFWSDIFGLTKRKKLVLAPWQVIELEEIGIFPNRVEETKAAQRKRRNDANTNSLLAKAKKLKRFRLR